VLGGHDCEREGLDVHAHRHGVQAAAPSASLGLVGGRQAVTWELHEGDCLAGMATLADLSVDHVITDPPYSERVHGRLGREGRSDGTPPREPLPFACLSEDDARRAAAQFARVARRWILIFCDEHLLGVWIRVLEEAGAEFVRKGTWVKTDAMPQMSGDRPSSGTEEIVIAHAPREKGERMRWNRGGGRAVWTGPAQERGVARRHAAQKPLWLMRALVTDFTDRGELILDPFAGSGSTGVAAVYTARRFAGWERDEGYAAIARARLAEVREQGELFGRVAT
jgi:DNA modification methylase